MLKYYVTVSLREVMKTSNQLFYLSGANGNLETCIQISFEQLKELKQFWGAFLW